MEKAEKGVIHMQGIIIAIFTLVVTGLIVYAGLSGRQIWFVNGPRSAAITQGAVGMAFCTISVGRFITAAPAHPLSILGYLIGTAAMLAFLAQIFQWKLPFVADPAKALWVIAVCIAIKTIIGRLYPVLR
jgi:EamA domain-containing membrane protein RarD